MRYKSLYTFSINTLCYRKGDVIGWEEYHALPYNLKSYFREMDTAKVIGDITVK